MDPVDVDLHVQEMLDRSALVPDGSDVKADTKDNVITLTGHVRTWAETRCSARRRVDGPRVIDVRDSLQVTG
jgi:osmotically-inducible protein OsmY